MNKWIFLIIGIILGLLLNKFYYYLDRNEYEYYSLDSDYLGEDNKSVLKKGTVIRYDQAFSEGFTRYVLYINIKNSEALIKSKKEKEIQPFWFEKRE
ncbi:hypothetical protein [Chryseobacterium phocaeense]|uniref:hypothetical protein n=1 Tax=Chryseobacterium phocaeense TaxID=1816690 RepID=UPI0009B9C22E|nr:hypothetical protein [Chryseobacterium phocaeense]